jgi:hypothetical protein
VPDLSTSPIVPDEAGTFEPLRPRLTSRSWVVLVLAVVALVALLAMIGFFGYQKFRTTPDTRIVGAWKSVGANGEDGFIELIFEFTTDGKFVTTFDGHRHPERQYRVFGETLEIDSADAPLWRIPFDGRKTETFRIITLTEKELVLEVPETKHRMYYCRRLEEK